MLALSPPWFPSFGWTLEDEMAPDQQRSWAAGPNPCHVNHNGLDHQSETAESDLQRVSSCPPDVKIGECSKPSRGMAPYNPSQVKKLNHNSNERDRRKKLNSLYSSLRALLPGTDHSKKLSIPATVSMVLKYIPELQKQVERLKHRKEEILSNKSRQQGDLNHGGTGRRGPVTEYPTIIATRIDEREAVVQICASSSASCIFSKLLVLLQDDDLQVLNASAFTAIGDRVFYNLHLQAKETLKMECGMLREKLLSISGHTKL